MKKFILVGSTTFEFICDLRLRRAIEVTRNGLTHFNQLASVGFRT
jgi:hypothetical protein